MAEPRIYDAFRAARDFYDSFDPIFFVDHKVDVKQLVENVKTFMSRGGKPYRIEVQRKEISKLEGRERYVWAWLFRQPNYARIYYSSQANYCWARWLVAKELAHLLYDEEPEQRTTDPVKLVTALVTDFIPKTIASPVDSESYAQTVAIELLVPWRKRHELYKMESSEKTAREIAEAFKVPEIVIISRLGKEYRPLCEESNDKITDEYGLTD